MIEELNEMVMVLGTPAQVAAVRRGAAQPRLARGPSPRWAAAGPAMRSVPGVKCDQPCPANSPWAGKNICCPKPINMNPRARRSRFRTAVAARLATPVPAPRGWCGPGEHLCLKKSSTGGGSNFCCCDESGSCVGGKIVLANNPIDWDAQSALVRGSSRSANPERGRILSRVLSGRARKSKLGMGTTRGCPPNPDPQNCFYKAGCKLVCAKSPRLNPVVSRTWRQWSGG